MTTKKQPRKRNGQETLSPWDQAILEAREKIKGLRFTVRVYKQMRDRGDSWPEVKSGKFLERED